MAENISRLTLTPGPVQVPGWVLEAMGQPIIHQRSAAFEIFFAGFQKQLQDLFLTGGKVCALPGSGTFGMEISMRSLFQKGDKVVVQANGKFSERWVSYGRSLGLEIIPWESEWGEVPETEGLRSLCEKYAPEGVVLTHCETSTGACIDLEMVAAAVKSAAPDSLVVVDAISTVGAIPLYMDDWSLDVVVTASQKALMNPAGITLVCLSPAGEQAVRSRSLTGALALNVYLDALDHHSYPFTPPLPAFYGISKALSVIQQKTLPEIWNETHIASKAMKQQLKEWGLTLPVTAKCAGDVVTTFIPAEISPDEFRKELWDAGLELAGGQGKWKGKVLRMGHFGPEPVQKVQACLQQIAKLSGNSYKNGSIID